ncbi:hypothetical protein PanWU01x14_330640, partial [Parasponia andersonii]
HNNGISIKMQCSKCYGESKCTESSVFGSKGMAGTVSVSGTTSGVGTGNVVDLNLQIFLIQLCQSELL